MGATEKDKTKWVSYCKKPFGGPEQVLEYLCVYTHRVAISNNRLVSMKNNKVTFRWKDYRSGNMENTITLDELFHSSLRSIRMMKKITFSYLTSAGFLIFTKSPIFVIYM